MRLLLILVAAACLVNAHGQQAGSYNGTTWSINTSRSLMWGGQPYLPIGWRIPGTSASIEAAGATGIRDAIIDAQLDSDWRVLAASAEKNGLRYILANHSHAAMAPAYIVRPSAYRIENVPRTADYSIPIPNGRSVFYLLLSEPDFVLAGQGWADVTGGSARITVSERISGGGYMLLLFPKVDVSPLPDFWEGFDARRDSILAKAKAASFGPGLRGFLDPAGSMEDTNIFEGGIVPDSQVFRVEFEAYLRAKYVDIASLERAWRTTSAGIKDFKTAARLVAMFGPTSRGVDQLFDPTNNVLTAASRDNSAYWPDVRTVIENAASRRTKRLAIALRQIANVPVVFEWHGWSPIYDSMDPAGDGLGIVARSGVETSQLAASAASSALSWASGRWLIASDLVGGTNGQAIANESALRTLFGDAAELGAKGWYVRWNGGAETAWLKGLLDEAGKDPDIANRAYRAVFYPENARFPANTMRLPGAVWWLPTSAAGERIDLGPDYEGYRHASKFATFTAMWRLAGPATVKLRMKAPERASFTRFDGTLLDVKLLRDGVEVPLDSMPTIIRGTDEVPVPQDALELARADYQSLLKEAKKSLLDVGTQRFAFEEAFRNFERNPGVSFGQMMDALRNLQLATAPYYWMEGESSPDHNFGEVLNKTATSNNRALLLSTPLKPDKDGYFAKYRLKTTDEQQPLDFWLAARIPEDVRPYVTVEVGGTKFGLRDAQSGYSAGYAWYSLGKLTMKKGSYTITVRVSPDAPRYEVAIDALLATPLAFRPQGPKIPRYVPGS